MKIRATIEYHTGVKMVNPNKEEKAILLESEKRCLIACLKHFWGTYNEANRSVKIEEAK